MARIPLVDLKAQYVKHHAELDEAIVRCLARLTPIARAPRYIHRKLLDGCQTPRGDGTRNRLRESQIFAGGGGLCSTRLPGRAIGAFSSIAVGPAEKAANSCGGLYEDASL